ncbi:uncharacterized protein LOC123481585 [Coregonus clupeaformis]|uniref:uncharacterized protein LOC123481585 n=1 Tax=Coregonus clupeaformis TaxID=59861 RepID=UPI001E1C3B59|nr:uncharacterized protein LOC123481585 [Coregonus clupeaformis]
MGTVRFTIAILLTLVHQTESSSVFVLKGQDVRLDVQGSVQLKKDFDLLFWKFKTSVNVVKYPPKVAFLGYEGRAELSEGNFSLLLKNLQEGDSGPYEAVVSDIKDYTVAKYIIEVQERVEPPVLTVDPVSTKSDPCNATVTCRGQNTSVTSICNNSTCSQVGGESRGAETSTVPLLSVYVAGGSIICNHSNQVSWANDTKEIETICVSKSADHNYSVTVVIIIIIFIIIFTLVGCALFYWRKPNKGGKREIKNTDYATVGTPDNSQAGGEEQVSPGEGLASLTIYSEAGDPHLQPVNHPMTFIKFSVVTK